MSELDISAIRKRVEAGAPHILPPADTLAWKAAFEEFVAHAPQDMDDLLAEVERLRSELVKARTVLLDVVHHGPSDSVLVSRALAALRGEVR
jgi:hypothetical protein